MTSLLHATHLALLRPTTPTPLYDQLLIDLARSRWRDNQEGATIAQSGEFWSCPADESELPEVAPAFPDSTSVMVTTAGDASVAPQASLAAAAHPSTQQPSSQTQVPAFGKRTRGPVVVTATTPVAAPKRKRGAKVAEVTGGESSGTHLPPDSGAGAAHVSRDTSAVTARGSSAPIPDSTPVVCPSPGDNVRETAVLPGEGGRG